MARLRYILGKRIRLFRLSRGWSQEVLGELAGINRTYVGSVERGSHNVSVDNIEKLAAALDVPPHALIMESEEDANSISCQRQLKADPLW